MQKFADLSHTVSHVPNRKDLRTSPASSSRSPGSSPRSCCSGIAGSTPPTWPCSPASICSPRPASRRLSPTPHPPLLSDLPAGRARLRHSRLAVRPGLGARLGRRSPQAPRPHRRRGRPAFTPRRPRQRSRGLWHAHAGWLTKTQGQADWKRYAADLYDDPKMRRIGRRFPVLVGLSLLLPTLAGFALHGWTLARRDPRIYMGRPGADLPRAPRHLVGELRLPLLRQPPLRHRRPLDQRRLAGAASRSANRGTTTTTRSRAAPATACAGGRSTLGPSSQLERTAWRGTSCGSRQNARPPVWLRASPLPPRRTRAGNLTRTGRD